MGFLRQAMPEGRLPFAFAIAQAGLGKSPVANGSPRCSLARWHHRAGSQGPWHVSVWWFRGKGQPVQYSQIITRAVRVADPFLQVHVAGSAAPGAGLQPHRDETSRRCSRRVPACCGYGVGNRQTCPGEPAPARGEFVTTCAGEKVTGCVGSPYMRNCDVRTGANGATSKA